MPEDPNSDPVLRVRNLTAGYGAVPVVNDVSIDARRGQITVIVGLNGSGKSTLLKAIAGVLKNRQGQVLLESRDVIALAPEALLRRGLSYVPQVANVFLSMTVRENLEMGGFVLRSGLREKISEICDLFPDLGPAMKLSAKHLSGGQRHMLAVARGLMVQPTVLLLDEPTVGLAPMMREALWSRLRAVRDAGIAQVVVDQNVNQALSEADWGYVMSLGHKLREGTGSQLLASEQVGDLYTMMTNPTVGRRLHPDKES